MEAQPLLEARLTPPGSWRAAGSAGTRSGLPLAARPPPPPSGAGLRSLSRSLRATPGAASSLSVRGAAAAAANSSCRTIWLSLRRKSGLTWRLPGHVTARAAASRRAGKVGRSGPAPVSEVGAVIGAGRGENGGKGVDSRLGGREEEENTPALRPRLTAPAVNAATRKPARYCLFAFSPGHLLFPKFRPNVNGSLSDLHTLKSFGTQTLRIISLYPLNPARITQAINLAFCCLPPPARLSDQ